jgi:hypothetical protein
MVRIGTHLEERPMARVTAVFADPAQAETAIAEMRRRGVTDSRLSIVARRVDDREVERRPEASAGERVAKGAITGVGVGTLFGLAAAVIPGIGPFIAAGPLASALGATVGAAATGAIVGGTSGALAGAMARADFSREEIAFYSPMVERGDILLTVDTDDVSRDRLRAELQELGGRTYGPTAPEKVIEVRRDV